MGVLIQLDHPLLEADVEQTPRAFSLVSLPNVANDNRSRSDLSSQESVRSDRSKSPIKKDDFRSCTPQIDFVEGSQIRGGDLDLFRRFRQAGRTVPPGLKHHLVGEYPYEEDVKYSTEILPPERIDAFWDFVLKIQANAAKCNRFDHTEASWGDQVVLKLLEFSKEWAGFGSRIDVANL